ncbi:hypothetical protein RJ639_006224 [Escallonia herrerae]|uniref:rRNA biogenesis protein RRP36 n=1 Tax=Escallonia herrerae TaxID=1293975 RepID=A0AA89AUC2_9ASTE|nr:hypothetical protein RJ639_006224 [Escallonia herrerae]
MSILDMKDVIAKFCPLFAGVGDVKCHKPQSKMARDPRFESFCSKLDPDWFKRKYNFIYENELPEK